MPLLLQLPIFYAMYHAVWLYQYHFTHGTFLWITPYFSHLLPGIIAPNLSEQDTILLFLYTVSMYVTQRMMPATDPSQAEVQKTTALFTSVFFFMFFQNQNFPSAFVLYWLISNILSTCTQLYFMRQGNVPPPGVLPTFPSDGDGAKNGALANGNGTRALSGVQLDVFQQRRETRSGHSARRDRAQKPSEKEKAVRPRAPTRSAKKERM